MSQYAPLKLKCLKETSTIFTTQRPFFEYKPLQKIGIKTSLFIRILHAILLRAFEKSVYADFRYKDFT